MRKLFLLLLFTGITKPLEEEPFSLLGEFFALFSDETDYAYRKRIWHEDLKYYARQAARHHFYLRELTDCTSRNFTPTTLTTCLFTEEEKKAIEMYPKIFQETLQKLRATSTEIRKKLLLGAREYASFKAYYDVYPENWNICAMRTSDASDFGWPGHYESQSPIYTTVFPTEYASAKQKFKKEKESGKGSNGTSFTLYPDTGEEYVEARREEEKKNQELYNAKTAEKQ